MAVTLRPAIMADADIVGPRLRAIDALECAIALGLDGPEAVRACIRVSPFVLAAHEGTPKEPFAVMGLAPLPPAGTASVWLLGTDVFDEHRKDLMRMAGAFLRECHRRYHTLVVQLAEINTKSIRFLRHLGFEPFPAMDLPDSPLIHLVRTAHV